MMQSEKNMREELLKDKKNLTINQLNEVEKIKQKFLNEQIASKEKINQLNEMTKKKEK